MRIAIIALMLTCAACSGNPEDGQDRIWADEVLEDGEQGAQSDTNEARGPLAGEWRVAGIDGEPLDESYGIALSGDEDELWWEPRCANQQRTYELQGSAISFGPAPSDDLPRTVNGVPAPPPLACTIGLPPRLSDIFRALDAATTAERTPSNGILISGGGHSVTLFSQ